MRYTLRQMEVFLATARTGNISRAAEGLAMSQSAASAALQDLERRYDTRLFDRNGKRLQLNEQGVALRPYAEALLDQANELERVLLQDQASGRLRVGATLTIGNYVAIPIVRDFRQRYPDVELNLHVANTEHIVNEVLNYEMDVGLVEGEVYHDDLDIRRWRDDELVAFCSPDSVYAGAGKLEEKDLPNVKWIVREPGSGTRQTFDRAMHGILERLDIHLQLEHTEAIKRAVEAGMGVGCLSRIALAEAFSRGSLVPLAIPDRDMSRTFYTVTHKGKYHSALLDAWLASCQAASP